nr:GGDEF domain-containing protein [Desulfuromonas acetoxidans]
MESSVLLWALLLICTAQLSDVQARVPVVVLHGLLILIVLVSVFERSYTLAFRDELTGLPSRRAFLDFVNRRSSGYSLAIVDIDHFKKVNDTHGHDVGDQVLKRVAGRLAAVSNGGKAFRYGGEEFVVLFYRRDVERVNDALDLLRQSIADTPFVLRQKPRPEKRPRRVVATKDRQPSLRVTVSIGVSHWHKGADLDGVIKRADQALYKAKKTGRNRVVKG